MELMSKLEKQCLDHLLMTNFIKDNLTSQIEDFALHAYSTIINGNKLILMGNGGSAGDAQHIAAEFVGRFLKERRGLAAISISTDTSAITAISNDYGYENVFSRQIEALAQKGDMVIGISTSGNSENVNRAILKAKECGCSVYGFSGKQGGVLMEICDNCIVIPIDVTARVQEMHIFVGHLICELVDDYCSKENEK